MVVYETGQSRVLSLAFSPDGRYMVSSCHYGLKLWTTVQFELIIARQSRTPGYIVRFSKDSKRLAVQAGSDISVYSLAMDPLEEGLKLESIQKSYTFTPENEFLILKTTRNWKLKAGKITDSAPDWAGILLNECNFEAAFFLNEAWIAAMFSSHETNTHHRILKIYDALDGRILVTVVLERYSDYLSILLSRDNRFLAIPKYGVEIWSMTKLQQVAYCRTAKEFCTGMCFTPDSRYLMTLETDSIIRLWDTDTWTVSREYDLELGRLTVIAVAPDGLRFAAGNEKGQIIVWDTD